MTAAELRDARVSLGLTQAALARLSGVHVLTISRYENAKLSMRPANHARLVAAMTEHELTKRKNRAG